MAIEKCPHCYRQVLVKEDRKCPSCSQSFDQSPDDDRAGRELIWLSKSTQLPEICLGCGNRTEESTSLQDFSMSRLEAFKSSLFRLRPNVLLALASLWRPDLASPEGYRMLRNIPCCPRCRDSNRPKIHKTDHHNFRLGILVKSEIAKLIKIQD